MLREALAMHQPHGYHEMVVLHIRSQTSRKLGRQGQLSRAHQLVTAAASSAAAGIAEAVEVDTARGVRRVGPLHKCQQALDGLQVLARGLVVHNMRGAVHDVRDLLTRRAFVDANAGDSNRPGIVACSENGSSISNFASPVLLGLRPCRVSPSSNGAPAKLAVAASWSLVELRVF